MSLKILQLMGKVKVLSKQSLSAKFAYIKPAGTMCL